MMAFFNYFSFEIIKKEYNRNIDIRRYSMKKDIQLNGCRLHITNTEKFKTTYVSIKFKNRLTKDTTTIRSLLSMVLLGGTQKLPSMKELAIYLEEMYGANLTTHISTKGSAQIIHLTTTFINEAYLPNNEALFEKQLGLMKDILFHPLYDHGVFTSNVVEMKKRELKERLAALKDDKYTYALDQTLDAMGKGQYLGISGVGYEQDIDGISAKDLSFALEKMLKEDTIEIYAVGHFTDENIQALQEAFPFKKRKESFEASIVFQKEHQDVQQIQEVQKITQAKFNMGFAANVDFLSAKHEAMTIFNGIFGAFSHSRLFKNVREKHSLCYYIASQFDAFNGLLMVSCGIESKKAPEVKQLVLKELEDIQNGHITDEELAVTKMMFKNSLQKSQDDPGNIVLLAYNRDIVLKEETIEDYLNKLMSVTKEEVIEVAKNIQLDTTFLLKGEA